MTSSQDFDRLSAYIDNQLSPRERTEMEARLAREPELQGTLSDLQRTVRALRLLPMVKPPRRLTLTPAMVGAHSRREPLFPALRLGAALSTLILALVVAGDFATSGGLASLTANSPQAAVAQVTVTLQVENPVAGAEAASATPEERVQVFAPSAVTPTEGSADAAATQVMSQALAAPTESPAATDLFYEATVGPTEKTVELTATPENTLDSLEPAQAEPTASPQPDAVLTDTQKSARQAAASGLGPLRVFEIAVAMLAILLGLGAWFTRRG